MIATLEGSKGVSLWERFSAWIVSTENYQHHLNRI